MSRHTVTSFLRGARKRNALVHVGNVGTGFEDTEACELKTKLDGTRTLDCHVREGKVVAFVEPVLAAEIE